MTYEQFERIGMDMGMPYALCKIAWEWLPFKHERFNKMKLEFFFRTALQNMPPEALAASLKVSSLELQEGALEHIAKKWLDDYKSKHGDPMNQ